MPPLDASPTAVEVSLNGQNFARNSVELPVQDAPNISNVAPDFGPTAGGTAILIYGSNIEEATCTFRNASNDELHIEGTYIADSSAMRCVSPPNVRSPLSLSLKWPLQLTTNMTFFEHPSALSISPHAGPVTGETLINVSGSNFPETGTTLCRMDNHVSAGSRLDDTTVLCISPTLHATSERHIVAHNFSYVPAESVLLGSAGVESGQLSLGAFNASGSLIFEADTPRGSHPHCHSLS